MNPLQSLREYELFIYSLVERSVIGAQPSPPQAHASRPQAQPHPRP
jgi:hypothetical protein